MACPPPAIGDIVLAVPDPNQQAIWYPTIVERVGADNMIVATSIINGNTYHMDACRHRDDEWWKRSTALVDATQEGIGMWKQTKTAKRLVDLQDFVGSIAMSLNSKRPKPKQTVT